MQNLGALPGYENSEAYDINDSGAVVGSSNGSRGSRAFVWTAKGGMRDLNQPDMIHPTAAGHRVVAENVWRVLEPILRETN